MSVDLQPTTAVDGAPAAERHWDRADLGALAGRPVAAVLTALLLVARTHTDTPRATIGLVRGGLLTARDGGSLVGACFTRIGGSAVDAFEVGLDPDHPHRHTAYSALVFASTVSLAADHGLPRVELGVGHPFPKAKRGASLTRLWDMTAR
ncbi:hypothetical protein ACTG9Q_31770 [Actinokineospora sp. 24-640]